MSKMENLNCFLMKRLSEVGAEVFEMFKKTLYEYEMELERMREDNQQLRQQITTHSSDGHAHAADGFSTKQQNFIQNKQKSDASMLDVKLEPSCDVSRTSNGHAHAADGFSTKQQNFIQNKQKSDASLLHVKLEVTALQHEDEPQQPSCDLSRTSTPRTVDLMEEPTVGKPEQNSDKEAADNVHNHQIMILKLERCDVSPPDVPTQDGVENLTEDQYRCLQCGETFSDSGLLNSHIRAHLKTADTCEVCRETLASCSCVTRRAGVAGERVKPFLCKLCGKAFSTSSILKKHIRIHTGEKPFLCRFCGRAFSQKGHCNEHERIHTGERPHTCSVCFQGYTQSTALKSHIRRRHRDLHRILQRKKILKQNPGVRSSGQCTEK